MSAIDVIIVHYHAADYVRDAVAALREDARRSGLDVHVLFVDNGSTPDERSVLRSLGGTYIATAENLGYAGAVNAGFAQTKSERVVVMNEDVVVLPGCLSALRQALDSGAAVAGPRFYWDRRQTILLPCTEERTRRSEWHKALGRRSLDALANARLEWRRHARRHWCSSTPVESTALSGALLAFRRDTWSAVGPFDAGFKLYFEENDWLCRVAGAGLRTFYVPAAAAIHLHDAFAAQSEPRRRWEAESFLRFGRRHYGERFMQRLLALPPSESATPQWNTIEQAESGGLMIELPDDAGRPLWVEVTPSPYGFPAAAARINDSTSKYWRLPLVRGFDTSDRPLYIQIVSDNGLELRGFRVYSRGAQSEDDAGENGDRRQEIDP
jgi:GT2 family glycosyltransferase